MLKKILYLLTAALTGVISFFLSRHLTGAIVSIILATTVVWALDNLLKYWNNKLVNEIYISYTKMWPENILKDTLKLSFRFDVINHSRIMFRPQEIHLSVYNNSNGAILARDLIGEKRWKRGDRGSSVDDIPGRHKKQDSSIICSTIPINLYELEGVNYLRLVMNIDFETRYGTVKKSIECSPKIDEKIKDIIIDHELKE